MENKINEKSGTETVQSLPTENQAGESNINDLPTEVSDAINLLRKYDAQQNTSVHAGKRTSQETQQSVDREQIDERPEYNFRTAREMYDQSEMRPQLCEHYTFTSKTLKSRGHF